MKRLVLLPLLLAACSSDPGVTPTPDFSVVEATRDTVTIRSTADPDDPAIVAEAQRLCSSFGSSATYFSTHDSTEVNRMATALMGAAGSSHVSYVPDHLFLCR